MNNIPQVEIIADSISSETPRLTTFKLVYWRPILAEMNTHRVFSRNASSSRAMHFDDLAKQVILDPWMPKHWASEQKGMVAGEEFDEETKAYINEKIDKLGTGVVRALLDLNEEVFNKTGSKIHKEFINRYLEPFRPVTQLVSATDWDNFFKLRTAPDAQPEIRDLAIAMQEAYLAHKPEVISDYGWHLPFLTEEEKKKYNLSTQRKISVARCARVSYNVIKDQTDLDRDIALHDRLLKNGHLSPFEHLATPMYTVALVRNFRRWNQYRAILGD